MRVLVVCEFGLEAGSAAPCKVFGTIQHRIQGRHKPGSAPVVVRLRKEAGCRCAAHWCKNPDSVLQGRVLMQQHAYNPSLYRQAVGMP